MACKGLALPGRSEGLWSLMQLQGESEDADYEAARRGEEEDRMVKDAEEMTRQAFLSEGENNANNGEVAAVGDTATATGTTTQDWLLYRAMCPMRRQRIMQDLISTRAYHAYQQAQIRYAQDSQQRLLTLYPHQDTQPSGIDDDDEEEDVEQAEARKMCDRARCQLQDIVDEIAAFNKQRPLPNRYRADQKPSVVDLVNLKRLRETFSERLLRLEQDEALLNKERKGGKNDLGLLSSVLRDFVLGILTEEQRQRRLEIELYLRRPCSNRSVSVPTFLRLFPTVRTFRDYNNQTTSQYLFQEHGNVGMVPSYLNAIRHLSWTIFHDFINSRNLYPRGLDDFLRSPYHRLESLRMSLVYPLGTGTLSRLPEGKFASHRCGAIQVIDDSTPSCLGRKQDKTTMDDSRAKAMQCSGPITSLTQLFIEDPMGSGTLLWSTDYRIPPWVPFIGRCPNLRSLALGSCPPPIWFDIARVLQAYCPRLQDLAVVYGRQLPNIHLDKCDPALAALLFACSHPHMDDTFGEDDVTIAEEPIEPVMGLKRLRIDALVLTHKSQALRMLLDYHSGSLTHLAITDCRNLQNKTNRVTLLKILRSFGQLEEVHLLPTGEVDYVEEDHIFDAQVLIDSITTPTQYTSATVSWACAKSLKVLRIMIGGLVCTSSLTNNNNNSSSSNAMDTTPDGELDLQRKIYRFLGSLTQLEELSLGFGPENNSIFTLLPHQGRQEDCLSLSLDSGLELLQGLKSLHKLNVARMNHKIGLAEVQWICESWPRLQVIEGLLKVKSLQRWVKATGEAVVGWSDNFVEDKRRESEIVCWLKEHRPHLRFT
ncbi:hypothetical protein BGW39_002297 [Mortierella sp. 14UC]|nr:hypothetical protein BGW39_002297 [Mortierella sp. 14UC]